MKQVFASVALVLMALPSFGRSVIRDPSWDQNIERTCVAEAVKHCKKEPTSDSMTGQDLFCLIRKFTPEKSDGSPAVEKDSTCGRWIRETYTGISQFCMEQASTYCKKTDMNPLNYGEFLCLKKIVHRTNRQAFPGLDGSKCEAVVRKNDGRLHTTPTNWDNIYDSYGVSNKDALNAACYSSVKDWIGHSQDATYVTSSEFKWIVKTVYPQIGQPFDPKKHPPVSAACEKFIRKLGDQNTGGPVVGTQPGKKKGFK